MKTFKRSKSRKVITRDDNSEYIAEHVTPNYVDRNGFAKSFKVVWISSIIIILLIGAWMKYNNESSSGYVPGSKYMAGTGKPGHINGNGVIFIASFLTLFGVFIFWPYKKKRD